MESKICKLCGKKYKETEFYVRHRNKRDSVCIYCRREEGRENARIRRELAPPKPPRESKIKDKKAYQHEYQQWYRKGVYRSPASIESLQRHKEKNWIEYMVNNPIYFEHIFRLEPTILNIITECKKLNLLEGNKNGKAKNRIDRHDSDMRIPGEIIEESGINEDAIIMDNGTPGEITDSLGGIQSDNTSDI